MSTIGKLQIALIATHSFPIPMKNLHTGDIVILDLANALSSLGHTVHLYAPEGTKCPPNGKVFPMRASYGKYPPSSQDCEQECYNNYASNLLSEDIVHDFSVTKIIVQNLRYAGKSNMISTLMGGAWTHPYDPYNLITWSQSHRDRVLRGATDYEGTSTPDLAGHTGRPVKESHVVNGGIDTNFYYPTYDKKNYYLWMNRWHPAKGYKMAIEVAKKTGIELVMAGEHPDNEMFDYQKQCALEAVKLAEGYDNIKFSWLPQDPDHHTAKRKLYQQAKALLYTIDFCEPFGLSQTEALACGTPVIGTNFGSVPEVITNNLTGLVCNNVLDDIAVACLNVEKIKPEICREQSVLRFDKSVMAKSYLKEYENILNNKGWV
jgi:glycosyltransferase involved in cell wall biosynthesis